MDEWIDRAEALKLLGVRPQTLYAYVSRGRISMRPHPADSRKSQYRGDDIAALTRRRARGRRPTAIAASAISWGEPSIETEISTAVHGRLIYRGKDAVALARYATLEETAALLWDSAEVSFPAIDGQPEDPFLALAGLARTSVPTLGRSPSLLKRDAAIAISHLAAALGTKTGEGAVHERLGRGWHLDPSQGDLLRRTLVLLADHELNASTFAARVAASTGASMVASLLAGLGALSGPRHGGAGEAAIALMEEAERRGAEAAVSLWIERGQHLPAFGHPLYPQGDPRAAALLEAFSLDAATSELSRVGQERTGHLPNVDFALAALTRSMGLPRNAPFCLFALGRSVGWAAHAMEQAATETLIRPRAIYRGRSV